MAESSADPPGGEGTAPASAAPAASGRPSCRVGVLRRRLVLASLALVAWFGFLFYETLATANPVIVSRPQVLGAPLVVEGTLSADPPRLRVDRVWKGDPSLRGEELALDRLPPSLDGADKVYVVPLEPALREGYRIFGIPVESAFRGHSRAEERIYPATDSVRRQLENILTPSLDDQSSEGAE